MEFAVRNEYRGKGKFLAIAAVLVMVLSCAAISLSADAAEVRDGKTLYIHGTLDSGIAGGEDQIIIVDGDLVIDGLNKFVMANNDFIVNEGVTLTIKEGTYVDVQSGKVEVLGKVVCEAGTATQPSFAIRNGAAADIKGEIDVNGPYGLYMGSGSAVSIDGTVNISETGSATIGGATVNNGGSLAIASAGEAVTHIGSLVAESGSNIDLSGQATFDSFTINDGASFVVKETGKLTASDILTGSIVNKGNMTVKGEFSGTVVNYKTLVADSEKDCTYIVVLQPESAFDMVKLNGMASLSAYSDAIKVDAVVGYVDGLRAQCIDGTNGVVISGTPAANATEGVEPSVIVSGNAVINENMTFPGNVPVGIVTPGVLLVTSYVTMIEDAEHPPISGDGVLTVKGTVQTACPLVIKSSSQPGLVLNAVYYAKGAYHYYTTFENALAANPDKIKAYGDIVFEHDTIVPNGTVFDMTEANSITITDKATVTVQDGGVFENGAVPITVNGTLILENTETSKTNVDIVDSDVKVESGIVTKFTNLTRALSESKSGDVIYLKRDKVTISQDTVIPEGVVLKVGAGHILELVNGAKLTVDGTLDANPGTYDIVDGTTVVNGCFLFDVPFETYSSKIPGAYYTLDGVNVVSPLGYIAGKESRIGSTVSIYGANTVGDVSLTGEYKAIYMMEGSSLNAGSVVLSGFDFDATSADSVDGKIGTPNGAVVCESVKGFALADNGEQAVLAGTVKPSAETAALTFSKAVKVDGAFEPGVVVKFAEDADVVLSNDFEFYNDATVPAGAKVTALGKVTSKTLAVAGDFNGASFYSETLQVAQGGTLGTDGLLYIEADKLVVDGTVRGGDNSAITVGTLESTNGKIVFGDDCTLVAKTDITSLAAIDAGAGLRVSAPNIAIGSGVIKENATIEAGDKLQIGSVSFGNGAKLTAATATVNDLNLGEGSTVAVTGDLTVTGDSVIGKNCVLTANNLSVPGSLTLSSGINAAIANNVDVAGALTAVKEEGDVVNSKFAVGKDVSVSGTADLSSMLLTTIAGDLIVSGTATMGSFSPSTSAGGSFVSGNTVVNSTGTLIIPDHTIWTCFKDLTVDGKLEVKNNSIVAVGSSLSNENGTVAVSGSVVTGADTVFTATNLVLPGTFTNSGDVVIGLIDTSGVSTIDGTITAKAGTFTMYRTVYLNGSILTENGKFMASKLYAGVDDTLFSKSIVSPAKVPVIGSGVTLTSNGVAYVSPAVNTTGCFAGFSHTNFYKTYSDGTDSLYLTVYANPGKYTDRDGGKNRTIDSVYASADDAYVNGWRATKTISGADAAAKARVTSPYGTYESVWMNSVYDIYNFKLYAADETATPMIGLVGADGKVTPLTLYKSGLNCYQSPVNLKAGTYRVNMTYADGHHEEYIDNPMVVNGVPQSNYDVTFGGNADNKELVEYLIQFSFNEQEPPVVVDNSMSLTEILLIVIVILIIVVAIVLFLRYRRA